jgi:DNA-binding response OmpR family regulator
MEQAMPESTRVLIVDDDEALRGMVAEYLAERDFVVDAESDGRRGLQRAGDGGYALLLLDVRLPDVNGFELLRRLRANGRPTARLPVLMLTAHGDEIDRIVGLEMGADDYLAKPFNPRELLARIHAILRRAAPPDVLAAPQTPAPEYSAPDIPAPEYSASQTPAPEYSAPEYSTSLRVGDVEMEVEARLVRRGGETLELSAMEFDLLYALMRAAGRVLERDELAREALGRRLLSRDRSLDIHVCKLRHKLWPGDEGLRHIRTVRGVGYIFVKDDEHS